LKKKNINKHFITMHSRYIIFLRGKFITDLLLLCTFTFQSMGQQHHYTALSDPLGLPTTNKLVKYTLCIVGKVSKLCLPTDQGIGVGHGVSHFKAQYSKLRQGTVADDVLGLVLAQVVQWIVDRL
jgi:hypothetical protein